MLTVAKAAEVLGCAPALVYKLCERRRLAHRRLGFGRGRIVISREQLDEYLRSCEVPALPPAAWEPPPGVRDGGGERRRRKAPAVRDRCAELARLKALAAEKRERLRRA